MARGVFVDITGKQFGHLTAVKHLGYGKWLCECSCGNTTITSGGNLRCGIAKSCGCIKTESARIAHTKHGTLTHSGSAPHLYTVWQRMLRKCYSKNSKGYKSVGGCGIRTCDEWRDDYTAFRDWAISAGYSDKKEDGKYSLIRRDKSLDYCPDNCEWAPAGTHDTNKGIRKTPTSDLLKAAETISLDGEEWRPVEETGGRYEISNYGRVRSTFFKNGATEIARLTILTPTDNGHGYKIIGLRDGEKRKNYYVHRLVAHAFIPNPNSFPVVDHIDHNRANNRADNLQWCTQKTNVLRSVEMMSKPRNKATSNTGEKYISRIANGKYKLSLPWLRIWKMFASLEDAVHERDAVLLEAN